MHPPAQFPLPLEPDPGAEVSLRAAHARCRLKPSFEQCLRDPALRLCLRNLAAALARTKCERGEGRGERGKASHAPGETHE
jgi:hypothetical protein